MSKKKQPFQVGEVVTTSYTDVNVDAGHEYTVTKCYYENGDWVINTCDAKCNCTQPLLAEAFILVPGKGIKDLKKKDKEFKDVSKGNERMLEI